MSKPSESVANEKMSKASGTFAPEVGHDGARENGQDFSTRASSGDLSPWKHRFMTALLDKLKVNRKSVATHSTTDGSRTTDSYGSLIRKSNPRCESRDAAKSRDVWLDETQSGDGSTRPMTFTYPPGSKPLPRYTIRRGIGIGGFGEVYFAVSDVGKEVALKRIQRNLEIELRGVSHCLNLKHPNLVALYDICRDDHDQAWVLMEFVAGPNLRQVLDESPQGLPLAEVRHWFKAIALGVNHLHSAGLVHRDLKPGNVFDDLGTVKVGDYGLSKFISASHRGGHTESVGTFHYMAPEIGRGQYGREIDIYAMGILLYELLTGRVPFDGESCHEIIVKHLTATADLQGIDEPYRSTIARCLEKDPAKRFSTVGELMQSLAMYDAESTPIAEVLDDQQPINASPINSAPKNSRFRKSTLDDSIAGNSNRDSSEPVEADLLADASHTASGHRGSFKSAAAPPLVDEPFARAIRHSFADLNLWWATLDRSPGAKAFLLLVAGFVLLVNTHWLLPLLSFIAVVYVPYYVVRQMVLHVSQQPTYAEAQRIAIVARAPRPMTRVYWRSHMRTDLRAKRSIHRVAELNTSWVAATFTSLALALGTAVIGLRSGPVDAVSIAPYGWMAIVVLLASLGILGMGKLWERDEGEGLPRRLVLAGLGAGVGVAAYAVNEFLMLPIGQGLGRDVDATTLPQAFYRDGVPVASAMMAHFALLFAALRWWKPVDPLRRTRLSLWSVAVAVVAEWAVHQVLPIPQPAGMMIAGGIAITVQMSAPWINPRGIHRPLSSPDPAPAASARSVA